MYLNTCMLIQLSYVSLSFNELEGSLPERWSNLTNVSPTSALAVDATFCSQCSLTCRLSADIHKLTHCAALTLLGKFWLYYVALCLVSLRDVLCQHGLYTELLHVYSACQCVADCAKSLAIALWSTIYAVMCLHATRDSDCRWSICNFITIGSMVPCRRRGVLCPACNMLI